MSASRPAVIAACLVSSVAAAEGPTFEISEQALNMVISRVGAPSGGGVAQPYNLHEIEPAWEFCYNVGMIDCPGNTSRPSGVKGGMIPIVGCLSKGGGTVLLPAGDAISWHWWISNAFVRVTDGAMTFTATVITRVDTEWTQKTRTVDASISYDASGNRLFLDIGSLAVPVRLEDPAAQLDVPPVPVSDLYRLAIDVAPQSFSVRLPSGGQRNINARITGATANYSPGLVRLTLDADF